MKHRKLFVGAGLLVAAAFLFGCGFSVLEPTQTVPSEASILENTSEPTETPVPTSTPDTSLCGALGARLVDIFGERTLSIDKETNKKCKVMTTFTGQEYPDTMTLFSASQGVMQIEGWREDRNYQADGPGGAGTGYRKEGELCVLSVAGKPVEEGLCSKNEPFSVCWDRLSDDQKMYELVIDCVPDSGEADQDSEPEPTRTPKPTSTPDTSLCGLLGTDLTDVFGERVLSIEKETSRKCTVKTTFTGEEFPNYTALFNALRIMMLSENWREDINYQADGPGGTATGFRGEVGLCLLSVEIKPGLCPDNEPFSSCWDRLSDEQKIFNVLIDCKEDAGANDDDEDEPMRIRFAPGAISGQEFGSLPAFGRDRYVLRAAKNQVMTVNLRITSGSEALLIIWGEDGSVFVTDHSETTYWQGELPLTQDYYITVAASPDGPVSYVLEVTIPPL